MAWKNYTDLIVWQKGMDLVEQVYVLISLLPKEERFSLSDQMRRAAISIPANIAEGHGRQTENEFKHFLSISKGSVSELETHLLLCVRLHYFSQEQIAPVLDLCNEVKKILTKLITTFSF